MHAFPPRDKANDRILSGLNMDSKSEITSTPLDETSLRWVFELVGVKKLQFAVAAELSTPWAATKVATNPNHCWRSVAISSDGGEIGSLPVREISPSQKYLRRFR